MDIWTTFERARRGFRDDMRLHIVAVVSLVVAFLCLGCALLGVENLAHLSNRWNSTQHMTVYLRDGASEDDVAQLRLVLENLAEIKAVSFVSQAQAKAQFSEANELTPEQLSALPNDGFPASLELQLGPQADGDRLAQLTERMRAFAAVDDIENYQDWLGQLGQVVAVGRGLTLGLAILVAICVVAVIGNTIRLAVANRRQEIEVLKLCGATDRFVRAPFILEGLLQGLAAATLAILLLGVAFLALRGSVEDTLVSLTGMRAVFLGPLSVLAVTLGGGVVGALGSALSLRRYMTV